MNIKNKIKGLFLTIALAIPTLLFNSNVSKLETSSLNTDSNASLNVSNNNSSTKNDKKTKDFIYDSLINSFNASGTYKVDDSYIYVTNSDNQKVKLELDGSISFLNTDIKYYSFDATYIYKEKEEKLYLSSSFNNDYSSIKHDKNIYMFKKSDELNGIFNFLNKNNYTSPKVSLSSLSFSSLFNDVFSSIKNDETTYTTIVFNNEIKLTNSTYNIYLDSTNFSLKSIKLNKDKVNDSYLDFEFNFKNKTNSTINKVDEDSSNIFETLFSYLQGNKQSAIFDINVNDSLNNNKLEFYGDLSLDYSNYDLLNEGLVDLNLTHMSNGNICNELDLRYDSSIIYFELGKLLKGRMNDQTIPDIVNAIDSLLNTLDFSKYIDIPLNALFNNEIFASLSDLSSIDINSLGNYFSNISLRNNLLSLDLDSSLLGLPKSLIHIEIGLSSLKLKTISVTNLKIDGNTDIDIDIRLIDFNRLPALSLSDYPSYDFIPNMLGSLENLIKSKSFGGGMSLQIFDESGSSTLISTEIDTSLKSVNFSSLNTLTELELALNNIRINTVNSNGNTTSLTLDRLTYQKDSTNNNTLFLEGLMGLPLDFKVGLDFSNTNDEISSLVSEINKYLKELGIEINLNSILDTIERYIELAINDNPNLAFDLDQLINHYALNALESFLKIDNTGDELILTLDIEYLLGYDMELIGTDIEPTIQLYWSIKNNELEGIFINCSSINNKQTIQFLYIFDTYNRFNFVSSDEESNFIDLDSIIDAITGIISPTDNNKFIADETYELNVGTDINKDSLNGFIATTNFKDYKGNLTLKNESNSDLDTNLQFVYDNTYNEEELTSEYIGTYYDESTYIDALEGVRKYIDGTLTAQISFASHPNSKLHIYSPSDSIINILEKFLSIPTNNILYTYKDKVITLLDDLFNGDTIKLLLLIQNGELNELLSEKYMQDLKLTSSDDSLSLSVALSPALFSRGEEEKEYSREEFINLSLDLEIITTDDSKAYKIHSFILNMPRSNSSEGINLSLTETGNSYTGLDEEILNDFTNYDPSSNNANFIDLVNLETLLDIGINTTNYKYFEISGELNVGIAALSFIEVPVSTPREFNAKIRLEETNVPGVYQTKAHITIHKKDLGVYDNDSCYVEYFTERLEDTGQEICYISKINGHKDGVMGEQGNVIYTNDISDTNLNNIKGEYQNTQSIRDYKSGDIYGDATKTKSNAQQRVDEINNKYGTSSATLDSYWLFGTYYRCKISKDLYSVTPCNYYDSYDITTFKVTQDELLKSDEGTNIPNLIYYLLDYALVDEADEFAFSASHEAFMGIIYNAIASSESSSSKTPDYIGMFGEYDVGSDYYSMKLLLAPLASIDELLPLNVKLGYDAETNMLSTLEVMGSGEDNLLLDGFYTLDATLSLNAKVALIDDEDEINSKIARYEAFIEEFKTNELTKDLDYNEVSYVKTTDKVYTMSIIPISIDSYKTNLSSSITFKIDKYNNKNSGFYFGL